MIESVRILPSGPHAFLAEYGSLDEVMHVIDTLRGTRPAGVVDVVPAARTILVTVAARAPTSHRSAVRSSIRCRPLPARSPSPRR